MKLKKRLKLFFISIFIILFLLILSIAGLYIFRNPIATKIIEGSGAAIFGAKVEVDDLVIAPKSLNITWKRLQVADKDKPMKNLFETGVVEFGLAFKPLLDKKVIIDEVEIAMIQFDTKRTTNGSLPPKPKKKKKKSTKKNDSKLLQFAKQQLNEKKKEIPVFNPKQLKTNVDVDAIINSVGLKTPSKVDSLKKIVKERENFWNNKFKNNTYKKDIKQIEKDIKSVERDIKKVDLDKIESLLVLQESQKKIKRVFNNSKKVKKQVSSDKKQFDKDLKTVSRLGRDIPRWIKNDYQKALKLANLPDVDVQNIAVMLFGEQVSDLLMKILDSAKKSKAVAQIEIESDKEEKAKQEPKPEKYPNLPKLWIKKIHLSGKANDGLAIEGNILDITDNQNRIKKQTQYILKGTLPNEANISINGKINLRGNYMQIININVTDIPIRDTNLSNFELLPKKLKRGDAKFNSQTIITDNKLISAINLDVKNIIFDPNSQRKMNKRLVNISKSLANSIHSVTMNAKMEQTDKDFDFHIDSNLDELISRKLREIVDQEVGKAKREVRRRIEGELRKYEQQLDRELVKYNQKLNKEMRKYVGDVNLLEKDSDKLKKKINKAIEDLMKSKEDDLNDAIEDGFNKIFGG